jgi:5-methylcytosine-specific restriction protein A
VVKATAVLLFPEVRIVPRKALKPCKHPGCPHLTPGKYCEQHLPLHPERESAERRGYNHRWRKVRAAYLRRHPLCVKCLAEGRYVTATVVDHIKPHRGDPHLMWDVSNYQALCKPCHDRKTGTEDSRPEYTY